MNYANIKYRDIADGEGVRTTLFVSGCSHHCENCFQPETWSFSYGQEFTTDIADEVLATLDDFFVDGLTFLGGEPMEPENQHGLLQLAKRAKALHPEKAFGAIPAMFTKTWLMPPRLVIPRKPMSC